MRRKAILLVKWLAVLGLVFSLTRFSFTQSPGKGRIVRAIDDSSPVTLRGNVRPMFRPENDMGPVEASFKLENISLMFKLTESQQASLTALLDELQNPSSPNFHQWLTPEQFANHFGLSQNDLEKVVTWLQAQGFTVTQTARSRTWVSFSGTAAQVQGAFQTEIHHFSLNGETYYANATEPSVPSALAEVVLGFRSLDNYRLKPRSVVRRVSSSLKPNFTSSVSGNHFLAPGDFATIYDVNALYSGGIDGTGQSIAVMGQTALYNNGSDITAFRTAAGLSANSPTLMLVPGSSNPGVISGDIDEASLDVEWAGAVAKNTTVIFVYANPNTGKGVLDSLVYTIDQNLAPVITISYGACEASWGTANLNALALLGQQANSQGQTIVAASGDSGAADCDSSVTVAAHGLAVDAPASLPYVTGMGGTEFNEGSGTYWQPAPNQDVSPSALSYIPEVVWNDTSQTDGLLSGGGGASAYFSKPSWQTGTGVPDDNARDVPDISLNASTGHDEFLFCSQGSCVSGFRASDQSLMVAGGTSTAAPTFAGLVALIGEQINSPQGNVNPILYALAASSPEAFHDITTGNNMEPCQTGTTDCPSGGPIGYSAAVGYDLASGLGSIDALNLATAWSAASSTGNSEDFRLGVTPSKLTIHAGSSGTASVSATPINNFSGSVSFTCRLSSTLAGTTCSVNPTSVSSGGSTTVTVTTTSSASHFPAPPPIDRFGQWRLATLALACLLLMVLSRRRRGEPQPLLRSAALRQVALGVVLAALWAASLSCGGGSNSSSGGTPTPTPTPETGVVIVQGSGPSTSHSVPISVTVN
jgi:subtilase family serine protease